MNAINDVVWAGDGWLRPVAVALLVLAAFASAGSARADADARDGSEAGDWRSRLFTPTHVTRLGRWYFIVDCWNHRCLYREGWSDDLNHWETLDETLAGPHSIATDGRIFVVEDTGRHGLRVYQDTGDGLAFVQRLDGLGRRTHRVVYDDATQAFYVVSSNSQHIAKLVNDGDRLRLVYLRELAFLESQYTRSLTIDGDTMIFVSGPNALTRVRYRDDSYEVIARYPVPEGFKSMNDLFRASDGWWYLTATPRRIIRTPSLEALVAGEYEDLYERLGFDGTPYYLCEFDGRLFIPQITQYSGVLSFELTPQGPSDRRVHFDFGPPTDVDWQRYRRYPK